MTGVICIYKEKDISSFGVVSKVRGITGEKKAGHTGTLDPMATGVLPVLLGGATRFLDYLPDSDKSYRAEFELGKTTDTLDSTGTVLSQAEVTVGRAEVQQALNRFCGEIEQLPPMYSAVSVNGKRLYELARQGKTVQRRPRKVNIYAIELLSCAADQHRYVMEVSCSKGTYIRTLIDDIGRLLGCGAVMTALERTRAMGLDTNQAVTLAELQRIKSSESGFASVLMPLDSLLSAYPCVAVTQAQATRFANGGALDGERLRTALHGGFYRVYAPNGAFLGLGKADEDKNILAVARVLVTR